MKIYIITLMLSFVFTSCKKNYTCECSNGNTTYIAGEIEGTKVQAKQKCKDLNTANTTCNLK
jgi:hypothetical protein